MTTGKTVNLTTQTFVSKVMSLLFNMLSSFVIAFLPRSKRLLIPWLQSQSAVVLESPKIKFVTVAVFPHLWGPDAMILVFWMLSFKLSFSLCSHHAHLLVQKPWCCSPPWGSDCLCACSLPCHQPTLPEETQPVLEWVVVVG